MAIRIRRQDVVSVVRTKGAASTLWWRKLHPRKPRPISSCSLKRIPTCYATLREHLPKERHSLPTSVCLRGNKQFFQISLPRKKL
jgi:hypothetical protein